MIGLNVKFCQNVDALKVKTLPQLIVPLLRIPFLKHFSSSLSLDTCDLVELLDSVTSVAILVASFVLVYCPVHFLET